MRLLHTGDWHVGKRLGRYSRLDDAGAVLDEIVDIARRENVDLVLVAGDLFDHPRPPMDALRLVLATLHRLAEQAPVLAIAGNHDSPELLDLLADYLRDHRIHLVGAVRAPEEGGVIRLEGLGRDGGESDDGAKNGETALVACLPFLREGQAVDFLQQADRWYGQYAERMAELCAAYDSHLTEHGDGAVRLVMGHFLVGGVKLGGVALGDLRGTGLRGAAPRGERSLHLGEHYAAAGGALPASAQYIALGHIHRPQPVPSAPVPAEYCGSPLELDFGEAGEAKRVVLVDVQAGSTARLRSQPLSAGRRLRRAHGSWEELVAEPELADAYLDLAVRTDGPDPSLAERARRHFPYLVKVRADYERDEPRAPVRSEQPLDQQFAAYYLREHGREPSTQLLAALREVMQETLDASA